MGSLLRAIVLASSLLIGATAHAAGPPVTLTFEAITPFTGSACASRDVCMFIGAVTAYAPVPPATVGVPIPANKVITYRIYRALVGGVYVPLATTTSLTHVLKNEPTGYQCYSATASVDGVESVQSSSACKVVRLPAPTDGKIEAPSDGAIEPRR